MTREKELRLALVCYGGISLAVYMHGITKEIWHLSRASQARTDGISVPSNMPAVYASLLAEIEVAHDFRLRVLADIIAGASAGGINGIFLAQAISSGQSLEPLTDLWLQSADVEALTDPDAAPNSRFSKVWALPIAWVATGRSAESFETHGNAETREEVRQKLSRFIRSRWFEPPFGGEIFTSLLLDAFEAMAESERGPRLLPEGQPLDLFVTVTDFAGHSEELKLNSPPAVSETEHRIVLAFSDRGEAPLSLAPPPELVFAARATSSFPGAFPPFQVTELDAVLKARGIDWSSRTDFVERILPAHSADGTVDQAALIDGSVLANAPFRPAIDALKERPAYRQIDRRFVYIDPFPGLKFRVPKGGEKPGFFQTIIAAISELPRQQPIRDNLELLAARSDRINRMRSIVDSIRPGVETEVETLFGHTLFLDRPTPARLANWRKRAQIAAAKSAGYGFAVYNQLKLANVIEAISSILHRAGGQSGSDEWRRLNGPIETEARNRIGNARDDAASIKFLRTFDLGFRTRRLRFIAQRLAEIDHEADGTSLTAIRAAVYDSLSAYLDVQRADAHPELRNAIRDTDYNPGTLLDGVAASIDLPRLDAGTDQRIASALALLARPARRVMLLAYLGFPYFDVATLPLLQGEGLDEFDPIKVDRIAPDDAQSIRTGGAEATLKGIQFNSFGAFFSRAYRENDYLWGRLHGAERLIDIIASTIAKTAPMDADRIIEVKKRAFNAILDEEEARLTLVPELIAQVRSEIEQGLSNAPAPA